MTNIEYAIEFVVTVIGFFGAIVGMLIWLTRVEQTLPYAPRVDDIVRSAVEDESLVATLTPEPAISE